MTHLCRHCNNPLTNIFVDLGHQPLSNAFIKPDQVDSPETYYPLRVYTCECGLVQIPEYQRAESIFNETYPYYSAQSPANVSHAQELVTYIMDRFNPKVVMEIGSNDGYLLQHFPSWVKATGIEPSSGPAQISQTERRIQTITEFFTIQAIRTFDLENRYDIICSINVLAHQPNLHDFVEGLKLAIKPDGITIHEFPHLHELICGNQFDTIYHEHYSYFSFTFICKLFKLHGLQVFDVERIPEHGGSLRVFAQHSTGPYPVSATVYHLLKFESDEGIDSLKYYEGFQSRIDQTRTKLVDLLQEKHDFGHSIVAYGTAAKGNTLLNSCRIGYRLISFAVDRSPYKQGCLLPGSRISIKTEDDLKTFKPDYVLILPWNLKDEIMTQLLYIREWGGKFIIPIPEPKVI